MTDETESGELTLAEVLDFATEHVEGEADSFDAEVPDHGDKLVATRATDLLQTVTSMQMAEAMVEAQDDAPDDAREQARDAAIEDIEQDIVDLFFAVGALNYEYDLDIEGAIAERMRYMESVNAFEDALEDADDREEAMAAMDEELADEIREQVEMQMAMEEGIEAGTNVDDPDYDAEDDRDRHLM